LLHFRMIKSASAATNMKKFAAFLAIPLMVVLSACGSSNAKINQLNADGFASNIQNPATVILDVRTAGEYAAGHIAGAINIDVESANFDSKIANLDKDVEYSIYCHSGRRSMIAANKMAETGFTKLTNLQDGIISWQAAGFPLVTN
jgi:phage shock protein E